jgi:hypothetical protein
MRPTRAESGQEEPPPGGSEVIPETLVSDQRNESCKQEPPMSAKHKSLARYPDDRHQTTLERVRRVSCPEPQRPGRLADTCPTRLWRAVAADVIRVLNEAPTEAPEGWPALVATNRERPEVLESMYNALPQGRRGSVERNRGQCRTSECDAYDARGTRLSGSRAHAGSDARAWRDSGGVVVGVSSRIRLEADDAPLAEHYG